MAAGLSVRRMMKDALLPLALWRYHRSGIQSIAGGRLLQCLTYTLMVSRMKWSALAS